MPPVISNTSPLIALATSGQLELLRRLFETVIIPPAVRAEVLSEAALAGVQAAIAQGWLSEQQPTEVGLLRLLNETLDTGESEAIALAQQVTPRWIILDDLAARRTAAGLGLPVIGTLGVLLLARDAGYLASVKRVLDQLRSQSLFVSDALYAHVLHTAGETE
jgi:predicted nucleic acid-binding protein